MEKGYKRIFWGVFIATFNIKLGAITILPAFVGWVVIYNGINMLMEEFKTKSFEKAIKYSKYLIGVSIIGELISIFAGTSINSFIIFNYYPILMSILELLIIFHIIDGSMEYLNEKEIDTYPSDYEVNLKTYTIFFVISSVLMCIGITLNNYLLMIGAIIAILLRISTMVMMNNLKKACL